MKATNYLIMLAIIIMLLISLWTAITLTPMPGRERIIYALAIIAIVCIGHLNNRGWK